jgi:hypothetical protein
MIVSKKTSTSLKGSFLLLVYINRIPSSSFTAAREMANLRKLEGIVGRRAYDDPLEFSRGAANGVETHSHPGDIRGERHGMHL